MNVTRNFWPLGIILTFSLFIPLTIVLVVIACLHKEELVSADYYEQEIRFQRQIDQASRTRSLPASVAYDNSLQSIRISLPADHISEGVIGSVQLYRPSDAGLDRKLPLAPDSQGLQAIDTTDLRPGLWKVRVQWSVKGQDYLIEQKLILSSNTSIKSAKALDVSHVWEASRLPLFSEPLTGA